MRVRTRDRHTSDEFGSGGLTLRGAPVEAVLLDLDDTLMADRPATRAAIAVAGEDMGWTSAIEPEDLVDAVLSSARRNWQGLSTIQYARSIQLSSWEALWAPHDCDRGVGDRIGAVLDDYVRAVWRDALEAVGVADGLSGIDEGVRCFRRARTGLVAPYEGAVEVVAELSRHAPVVVVTNGTPGLQRLKLHRCGLLDHLSAVVISSEIGAAKPHKGIFTAALSAVACRPSGAVMVGDSEEKDVGGARSAGIRSILVSPSATETLADDVVLDLRGLPAVLGLSGTGRDGART